MSIPRIMIVEDEAIVAEDIKGSLENMGYEVTSILKIYDKRVEAPPHYDTFAEFHYSYHYGDMYSPFLKQDEPLKVECQQFLNAINTGKKPETSGLDGLRVVQIL